MPKFFCSQCGQPVDTGDSFAPADTSCPACRGEMPLASAAAPPLEVARPSNPPPVPQLPPEPEPYHAPKKAGDPTVEGKQRKWALWMMLATVVAGVIVSISTFAQNSFDGRYGTVRSEAYVAGQYIGGIMALMLMAAFVGLLAAGIRRAAGKPFRSAFARSYCIAVLILAVAAFFGSSSSAGARRGKAAQAQTDKEARQAIEGMKDDMEAVAKHLRESENSDQPGDFRLGDGDDKIPEDDAGKARYITQSIINDMFAVQKEYQAALDKAGLAGLFDVERLVQDKDFSGSRKIVAELLKVAQTHREKGIAIATSAPERAEKYNMNQEWRRKFVKGYEEARAGSMHRITEPWDLEIKAIEHMAESIDHLEASRENWQVQDGLISFARDEDLETFNAIMAKIDACAARQAELQQNAIKRAESGLKDVLPER